MVPFAGTYDHSQVKLYINGVLSANVAATANMTTDTTFRFGGEYNRTYFFNGTIDEIRISNTARPPMKSAKHMNMVRELIRLRLIL